MDRRIVTSESVSEGHPDKVCDRLSDAVVDRYIAEDPGARVACETLATTNFVMLAGETSSTADVGDDELEALVRDTVRDIGYEQRGFHWRQLEVVNKLHRQSGDIAMGVDPGGAGDQGIMFGFACDETPEYLSAPFVYATRLVRTLAELRRSGAVEGLGPDAKSQVSLRYDADRPVEAHSVLVSTQHDERLKQADVEQRVRPVIERCLPESWLDSGTDIKINPTGRFVVGGPDGDAGLTGRKIVVDTYGGAAPHGGGAFSGKDPSKVDRSAAYACRYLAKNVVAAGLARRCTIQISYAIGIAEPQSMWLNLHGGGSVDADKLVASLRDMVDLKPAGIRKALGLDRPIYSPTAAYGHFGREPGISGEFRWEKTDLVGELKGLA